MRKKHIILSIILTLIFSSCSITKTKKNTGIDMQKNEQKFVYLFSEANKNRLLGNTQKALELYITAIDINPKSAASNYYLASLFLSDKNYSSALTFAENAVKLQPNNIWYGLIEADIYSSQNNINEAYIKYSKLQKQYPRNEILYDRIIQVLLDKLKNYNNSRKQIFDDLLYIYNQKQKHFGFDSQIAEYIYNIYIETNDIKNASTTLQELIKYEPNNPRYLVFLAENYVKSKKNTKAKELYIYLNNKYPNNLDVKLSYVKYCKFIGNYSEYFKTIKNLLSSNLQFNKKVNLITNGRYPNFPSAEYKKLLNILYYNHPNKIVSNTLLAEFYIDNNKNKALPYLIKATELSKGDFNLILTLFEVAYDTKNYETLYLQSLKYLQLYPNQAKIFLYNGIGAYKTKRYKKAILVLETGKDLVIEDNDLLLQFYFYLAETYHNINNNTKSDDNFEKVIKLNPNFYLALNNYSYYLSLRKQKLQKALSMAETCINYQPENPVFCDTYAKALFENENYIKALKYSEKAINIIKNNPDFLENFADILFVNNKKEEALKNWKLSKENGSLSKNILYKIENINKLKIEDL